MYINSTISPDREIIPPESHAELFNRYRGIEDELKRAFKRNGIDLIIGGTTTCFDAEVATVSQPLFVDAIPSFIVPEEIMDLFSNHFIHSQPRQCSVKFALIGRMLLNDNCYATGGLEMPGKDCLYFDYGVHSASSSDQFLYQFIHELLHFFGITEENMPAKNLVFALLMGPSLAPYTTELQGELMSSFQSFKRRCRDTYFNSPNLGEELVSLSEELSNKGVYPFSPLVSTSVSMYFSTAAGLLYGTEDDFIDTVCM